MTSFNNIHGSKNTLTADSFLFFAFLYYLIFIAYGASLINTLHFILHQDYSRAGSLLGRCLFLIFITIYLLKPQFGSNLIYGLVNQKTLNFFKKSIFNLQKILKNYSFACFLFVHLYLCFLVLHWFCLLTNSLDIYLEYGYHVLNIIRLSIFPLIIYFFIIENVDLVVPSHVLMAGEIKETITVVKEIIQAAVDFGKKNPKTSATVIAGTAVLGGLALNGSGTTRYIEKCENHPNLTGMKNLPIEDCIDSQSRNIRGHLEKVIKQSQQNPVSVGLNNLSRTINNRGSLSDEYTDLTNEILLFKWQQMDLERSLTGTTASHAINSSNKSKKDDVLDQVDNENASDLTQVEVHTVLELKSSFLNYFF